MLEKPKHITSLRSSCVVAVVETSIWAATKQDKESSEELTASKNADKDAASVTQHLLGNMPEHKALKNYRQTIHNWVVADTYPWLGNAVLVPVARLPRFMKKKEEHETEFNRLKGKFGEAYKSAVSNRAFSMGQLFNPNNYPPLASVLDKFRFKVYITEVPAGDFRETLFNDAAQDYQDYFNKTAQEKISEILDKQADQFVKVMDSLSETCAVETVVGDDGKIKVVRHKLHEATVKRAIEYCDTFKTFNPTENPKLEQARESLERVLRDVDVAVLRESDTMRIHVKNEVDDILKMFKGV
jgi:hypothetical protein